MKKYIINIANIHAQPSSNTFLNDEMKSALKQKMDSIHKSNNSTILMNDIRDAITPILEKCDVFISYSSSDITIVKNMVGYFKSRGVNAFADCLFWNDIEEEIRNYNELFCKNASNSYDYCKVKKTFASFHVILMDSIYEMIKKSIVFLFVNSPNSLINDITKSPWIYLENKIANELPDDVSHSLTDSYSEKSIIYPMELKNFEEVRCLETVANTVNILKGRVI